MKTKKTFFGGILLFCALFICAMTFLAKEQKTKITIGILAPMPHAAMDEIARGVKDEFQKIGRNDVEIQMFNAQGDLNLQQVIIRQLKDSKTDILMPIGTGAMQMTLQNVKEGPIIGLAANFSEADQKNHSYKNATYILDEVDLSAHLQLINEILPNLQKITVIYSPSEKIYPEIQQLKALSKKKNLEIQFLMIQQMSELSTIGSAISFDSQAIFILKDHPIVSGTPTIAQEAKKRQIPLITSDEGSIASGGAFALGVAESDIGKTGAQVALKILKGSKPEDIPNQKISSLKVFVNKNACKKQGLDFENVEKAALKFNYTLVTTQKEK